MAKLTTPVPIPEYPFGIHHRQQLLSMGSCFAEHVGAYLGARKFQQLLNPFGIIYHPLVLAKLLQQTIDNELPQEQDLFEEQGLWRHYDFHSRYAHHQRDHALASLHNQYERTAEWLKELDTLILTFGTAYGYCLKASGEWVNNCHKQPGALFDKSLASVETMHTAVGQVLKRLKTINPDLQVILTISPVRHLRDGLLENQRSKARLLLTQESLCEELDFVHYFPAYEILLDELRDYRYYTNDLLHPSSLAIEIITERFGKAFFSAETAVLSNDIYRLVQASDHRPLHPDSDAAASFRKQTIAKMEVLMAKYDWLDFADERTRLLRPIDPSLPGS